MAGRGALLRLLRLRELEEELSRQALELAAGRHRQVQAELDGVQHRQAQARAWFVAGVEQIDSRARTGGLLEIDLAERQREAARIRLEQAETELARQRAQFLERRTKRRQVQTLMTQQRTQADLEAARRAQQMLDDWYGRRSAPGTEPGRGPRPAKSGGAADLHDSKT